MAFRHLSCVVVAVAALSSGCSTLAQSPEQRWAAYEQDVLQQRSQGQMTASEAQQHLRDEYRKLFGQDPNTAGFYAYSISLLQSAERGAFPMSEAQELIKAKEEQLLAERALAVRAVRPEANDASD